MIKLDKEKLTKLYKEEGWSISALTEEFKVGRETIKANIEFYNIILSAEDLITAKRFKEERKKQTLLQKYGVDNVSKIKKVRDKVAEGNKRYQEKLKEEGITPFFATEEGKKAARDGVLRKYGMDNINKTEQRRNEMRENWKSKSKEEKRKWIEKCRMVQTKEVQQRISDTKRRNNSFHISSWEAMLTEKLSNLFPDLKTQYKDKRYPFHCDFYIPSLDLFIECNFHWTHGRRPFNPNNEKDMEQLRHWEELGRSATSVRDKGQYYKNAITTWTDLDVRKRTIAEQNGLSYLVFYFLKDAIKWVEEYPLESKDNSN